MSTPSNPTPTQELEAVNTMLAGIGESPINSFNEVTTDVSIARSVLTEVSRETQTEGFHWNTEENYPVSPDSTGYITLSPSIIRVTFEEHRNEDITLRGRRLYDRVNHTYIFDTDTTLYITVTFLLPFDSLPETARRYITLKALRIFQQRVVGANSLSEFHTRDETFARALMLSEQRRQDKPNLLTGSRPAFGTWNVSNSLLYRGK